MKLLRTMRWERFAAGAALLLPLLLPAASGAQVALTKHNLSVSGPGAIRAVSETRICIFCHAPHRASQTGGVLWNHADSTQTYVPYDSATLRATVGQPTGASKMCLACHDGTVALGQLVSESAEIGLVGGVRFLPPGTAQLGIDLGDDHPISFDYDAALVSQNPEIVDPSTLTGAVQMDPFGQMQCTSCHDPHESGFGKFLVASPQNSALCLVCHDKPAWPGASHALSTAAWNGTAPDPWPHGDFTTVAENACENCHRPHSAGSTQWILNEGLEEDNCLVCHNGNVAATDIQSQITLASHHPVELTSDVHTPNEDPTVPLTRHVECSDCHDPHSANGTPASGPPMAGGALAGVTGLTQGGSLAEPITYQYELCYKCHGEFSMSNPSITRVYTQADKRLQFDPTNPSYHPIVSTGQNLNVPSLLPPLLTSSQIDCTACHASSTGPGAGGLDPAGPHGSSFPHILERSYNTLPGVVYTASLYGLCYKCHTETSILANESFPSHKLHIAGNPTGQNAPFPCSACHDPHGISATQGNSVNNSNLINFDLSIVSPLSGSPGPLFEDLGSFSGQCSLVCHGITHDPATDAPPKKY